MEPIFKLTWLLLLGLSLIFVGGFVLWVYGAQTRKPVEIDGPERDATRQFHAHLVKWFFLYGVFAVISGLICLMIVAPLML
ncbi:MAG: hypothetical protein P4M15_14885 [Alphaproteobacteria bacterium]|nr:hypothetical protein [Alphaproteobacteria bacterium]